MHPTMTVNQDAQSDGTFSRQDGLDGLLYVTNSHEPLPNLLADVENFLEDMKRSPQTSLPLRSPQRPEDGQDIVGDTDTEDEDMNNNSHVAKVSPVGEVFKSDSEGEREATKPTLSYIALISLAIQSSSSQRMLLADIYSWVAKHYPYYRNHDRSWRNSIRHNLSLNECFIKSGRSENGKGNYWAIHPANVEDFSKRDFRRRRARRQVRKSNEQLERLQGRLNGGMSSCRYKTSSDRGCHSAQPTPYSGYVPMTVFTAPSHVISSMFGPEVLRTCRDAQKSEHNAQGHSMDSATFVRHQAPPVAEGTHQSQEGVHVPAIDLYESVDNRAHIQQSASSTSIWNSQYMQGY